MRHIGAHLLVHGNDAPGADRDAGGGSIGGIAVGAASHGDEHPVEQLRLRHIGPFECRAQALRQGVEFGNLGIEQNALVALFNTLLQGPHQVPIRAGHQAIAQFHHRDLHAERVVNASHLQTDDAAADHQQPFAIERQFQRAGGIDDARIIRQSGQTRRL